MMIAHIEGATRVVGKSQGYHGLPIKDATFTIHNGQTVPCVTSAWHPTPKELQALLAGASVHVTFLGSGQPPVLVEVGPIPEERIYDPNG